MLPMNNFNKIIIYPITHFLSPAFTYHIFYVLVFRVDIIFY